MSPNNNVTDSDRYNIVKSLIIGRKTCDFPLPNIKDKYITEENLEAALQKLWAAHQNKS